jgi:putative phosphoribosyl transferase
MRPLDRMRFADRSDAGEQLARVLAQEAGPDVVVLGIPRGGVIVAETVAHALDAPLDVVVPRKIGAPGNPELGLGAVAPGVRVLDERLIARLHVSDDYLESEIVAQLEEIARRERAYRRDRPPLRLRDRTVIVVDDGIATGGTAVAALRWARERGARRVVLAVPVAPAGSEERLSAEADRIVVLRSPEPFVAVGEWYRRFDQTTDAEVVAALGRKAESSA